MKFLCCSNAHFRVENITAYYEYTFLITLYIIVLLLINRVFILYVCYNLKILEGNRLRTDTFSHLCHLLAYYSIH